MVSEKQRKRTRAYYEKNKDKIKRRAAERYQQYKKDPEFRAQRVAYGKIHRERRPLYYKDFRLKLKYGISIEEFLKMLEGQNGKCPTCDKTLNYKTGHVDHCHSTKVIRGILCGPCNRALGMVYESIPTLKNMITYLEEKSLALVS